jgi:hypothetical protein
VQADGGGKIRRKKNVDYTFIALNLKQEQRPWLNKKEILSI